MCIMDSVGHSVTPLHLELVLFGIATKRIVFGDRRLAFRDTTKEAVKGIMSKVYPSCSRIYSTGTRCQGRY